MMKTPIVMAAIGFALIGCTDLPATSTSTHAIGGHCTEKGGVAWAATSTYCSLALGYPIDVDPDIGHPPPGYWWDPYNPAGWAECMDYNTQQTCSFLDEVATTLSPTKATAVEFMAKFFPGQVGSIAGGVYSVLTNLVTSFETTVYAPENQLLIVKAINQAGATLSPVPYVNQLFAALQQAEAHVHDAIDERLRIAEEATRFDPGRLAVDFFVENYLYTYRDELNWKAYQKPKVESYICFGYPINDCTVDMYQNSVTVSLKNSDLEVTIDQTCYDFMNVAGACPGPEVPVTTP